MSKLYKKLSEGLAKLVYRKEVVGTDSMGNQYFRWYEPVAGQQLERREVQWAAPHMMYEPHHMPPEWRMWLRKLRDDPPSQQELQKSAANAETLRTKVQALEEQDKLRRLRQAAQASQAAAPGAASGPPDMSRMLQQVEQADQGGGAAGGSDASSGSNQGAASNSHATTSSGAAAGPGFSSSSQPSGKGDQFKPGAWQPGSR